MSDEGEPSDTTVCEACGTAVPTYDIVNYGSIERDYRALCTSCFNVEVASALGLEHFEHVRLEPVVMTDCAGEQCHAAAWNEKGFSRVIRELSIAVKSRNCRWE
ncbi:MAG TPA: hypothetical protein VMF86_02580 [Stellaceae bacterium]|nr:hypothetical protein [Stellaceae bacterium]